MPPEWLPEWFGPVSEIEVEEYWLALVVSLAASVAAWGLYVFFYRDWERGAGIHRVFLLAGPAITVLFISIQFSLPLSLGLLGALSFVRFRTPIKDPAEIGYLLLVIAASIAAATYNYEIIGVLFAIALVVLGVQRAFSGSAWAGRLSPSRDLVITLPSGEYAEHERELLRFLSAHLRGLRHEAATQTGETATLHARFRSSSYGDEWGRFRVDLETAVSPSKPDIFVG